MIRVLLVITHAPFGNTAGMRTGSFAKYFPQHGVEPVVLQLRACPSGGPVHSKLRETGCPVYFHEGLHQKEGKLQHYFRAAESRLKLRYLLYGYQPVSVYLRARSIIDRIVTEQSIDVVLGSYPAPLSLGLASWASRKYDIPWIADFRDILDQIDFGRLTRWVYWAEHRTVSSASLITTVSEGIARRLRARYDAPVEVIYNGFFPEYMQGVVPARNEKFTVLYTGMIYKGRDPRPLMQAAVELEREGLIDTADFELAFYGPSQSILKSYVAETGAEDLVAIRESVPHDEVKSLQAGADVLLLLPGSETNIDGILTAKLFEYMAVQRPVLSIDSPDSQNREIVKVLQRTNAGKAVSTVPEIREYLLHLYRVWKERGTRANQLLSESFHDYGRDVQAGKLANRILGLLT